MIWRTPSLVCPLLVTVPLPGIVYVTVKVISLSLVYVTYIANPKPNVNP